MTSAKQDLGAMEFLPRIALLVAVGNREIDFNEGGTGGGTWNVACGTFTRPEVVGSRQEECECLVI